MGYKGCFGLETEYGLTYTYGTGSASTTKRLIGSIRRKYPYLRGGGDRSTDTYMSNGSRIYMDCGHPEVATPECNDPYDLVKYTIAGDRILSEAIKKISRKEKTVPIILRKGNVNYGFGTSEVCSWGSHESYIHYGVGKNFFSEKLIHILNAHFITRVIICGGGGFDPLEKGIEFSLSPRMRLMANGTICRQSALFGTKGSTSDSYRLHVTCGDSIHSEIASLLRFGTTDMLIRIIENGENIPDIFIKGKPPMVFGVFSSDPTCKYKHKFQVGKEIKVYSAIDIQRLLLEAVEKNCKKSYMPPWAEGICKLWAEVLDKIEDGAPDSVSTMLDWAIKYRLYTNYMEKNKDFKESISEANAIMDKEYNGALRRVIRLTDCSKLEKFLKKDKRFRKNNLGKFLLFRYKMLEIDMRFGELSENGIFNMLDAAGTLDHKVDDIGDIEEAMLEPPKNTRAYTRGKLIAFFNKSLRSVAKGEKVCNWRWIHNRRTGRTYSMHSVFEKLPLDERGNIDLEKLSGINDITDYSESVIHYYHSIVNSALLEFNQTVGAGQMEEDNDE